MDRIQKKIQRKLLDNLVLNGHHNNVIQHVKICMEKFGSDSIPFLLAYATELLDENYSGFQESNEELVSRIFEAIKLNPSSSQKVFIDMVASEVEFINVGFQPDISVIQGILNKYLIDYHVQNESSDIEENLQINPLQISQLEFLIPRLRINYRPHQGVRILAGYSRPGQNELILRTNLSQVSEFIIQYGENYFRIPELTSKFGSELLESGGKHFPEKDVSDLINHHLPRIENSFIIEKSDEFSSIYHYEYSVPLRPKIIIDFRRETGLIVTAGFSQPGKDELIFRKDLVLTSDEQAAICDDVVRKIPTGLSELGEHLIQNGETTFGLDSLHTFILNEIPNIGPEFELKLTDNYHQLSILTEPLKPIMDITYHEEDGLELDIYYQPDEHSYPIPVRELNYTFDGTYAYHKTIYFPIIDYYQKGSEKYSERSHYKLKTTEIPEFLSNVEHHELNEHYLMRGLDSIPNALFSRHALEVTTYVDYELSNQLIVTMGYKRRSEDELIKEQDLTMSSNGEFAFIQNVFYPIPKNIVGRNRLRLSQGRTTYTLNQIPYFFMKDLLQFSNAKNIRLSDSAERITVISKPTFTVEINEPGWLDFNISYSLLNQEIPVSDLIIYRNDSFYQASDFEWIDLDDPLLDQVFDMIESRTLLGNNRYRIPLHQFLTIENLIDQFGGEKRISEEYQSFLDNITDFQDNPTFQMPQSVESRFKEQEIDLYPHQRSGIHWMNWLTSHGLHALLADDMGLGKTLQTIATIFLGYYRTGLKKNSLIICPKSVISFWAREIRKWFPELNIYPYQGSSRIKSSWASFQNTIFIANYDTIRFDIDYIRSQLAFVVLDEGQNTRKSPSATTSFVEWPNSNYSSPTIISQNPL